MAPFGKGGGPKDRGIFASSRHFHERRKVEQLEKDGRFSINKITEKVLSPASAGVGRPVVDEAG